MTNEEMIDAIKSNYPPENYTRLRQALDKSIELLRQEDVYYKNKISNPMKRSSDELFKYELLSAIDKYRPGHIAILFNTEAHTMYGLYHSSSTSFSVTNEYPLDRKIGVNLANSLHIGWTELD